MSRVVEAPLPSKCRRSRSISSRARPMVAPLCKHVPTFAISQRCGTCPAPASRLANPKLVFKKRLQFHKEISYVRISFAHAPHDQENLVTEVKCGSAQAL